MSRIPMMLVALTLLTGAAPAKVPETDEARTARLSRDGEKAQRDTVARYKRWDNRMRKTMGAVCKGC